MISNLDGSGVSSRWKCLYLLGKLLGEYHKNEKLKRLYIYFGLLGHLQELHETHLMGFYVTPEDDL